MGLQLYLKFRREHPHERILAFDTDFSKFVSSNLATLPTGGYFAVWLALARCAQVTHRPMAKRDRERARIRVRVRVRAKVRVRARVMVRVMD